MPLVEQARDSLALLMRTVPFKGRWRIARVLNRMFAGTSPETRTIHVAGVGRLRPDLRDTNMLAYLYWVGLSNTDRGAINLLERLLPPDAVFVDVGANVGVYTLAIGRHLTTGRVIAFEPNPVNYRRLLEHIELNGLTNVTTEKLGISDCPGRLEVTGAEHPGNWTLKTGGSMKFEITLTTLDAYFAEHPVDRVDAIKMDIEGVEPMALRGTASVIERYRPAIFTEVNPELLVRMGSSVDGLLDLIEANRYRIFDIPTRRSHPLAPVRREAVYNLDYTNLVAFPIERTDLAEASLAASPSREG